MHIRIKFRKHNLFPLVIVTEVDLADTISRTFEGIFCDGFIVCRCWCVDFCLNKIYYFIHVFDTEFSGRLESEGSTRVFESSNTAFAMYGEFIELEKDILLL